MTSTIPGGRSGVEGHFKPEFVNPLDDIVEFDSLTREQIGAIVEGRFVAGDTVNVGASDGELVLGRADAPAGVAAA